MYRKFGRFMISILLVLSIALLNVEESRAGGFLRRCGFRNRCHSCHRCCELSYRAPCICFMIYLIDLSPIGHLYVTEEREQCSTVADCPFYQTRYHISQSANEAPDNCIPDSDPSNNCKNSAKSKCTCDGEDAWLDKPKDWDYDGSDLVKPPAKILKTAPPVDITFRIGTESRDRFARIFALKVDPDPASLLIGPRWIRFGCEFDDRNDADNIRVDKLSRHGEFEHLYDCRIQSADAVVITCK